MLACVRARVCMCCARRGAHSHAGMRTARSGVKPSRLSWCAHPPSRASPPTTTTTTDERARPDLPRAVQGGVPPCGLHGGQGRRPLSGGVQANCRQPESRVQEERGGRGETGRRGIINWALGCLQSVKGSSIVCVHELPSPSPSSHGLGRPPPPPSPCPSPPPAIHPPGLRTLSSPMPTSASSSTASGKGRHSCVAGAGF